MKRGEVVKGSKWALITGTNSGIGLCYATRLATLGYNIIAVGRNEESVNITCEKLIDMHNISAIPIIIDLSEVSSAQTLFEIVHKKGINIDVLINNAGTFSFLDTLKTPIERIHQIITIHDITVTTLCRLFAQRMIETQTKGRILNMSSFSLWMPVPGLSIYSASKAFIRTFTISFAKEVAENGITVTAVCPAGVATNLYSLSPRWQKIGEKLGVLITADSCAKRGLRAMWRGRRCIVPDWWNRAWIPLFAILPMFIIRPIRKFTMRFQK